jgi:hypothetical protein
VSGFELACSFSFVVDVLTYNYYIAKRNICKQLVKKFLLETVAKAGEYVVVLGISMFSDIPMPQDN